MRFTARVSFTTDYEFEFEADDMKSALERAEELVQTKTMEELNADETDGSFDIWDIEPAT
jgi:uncharacterized protein YjbK